MLKYMTETEATPPLYYVLAWPWAHVFGTGEIALRSFSAVIGTATVPLMYAAGKELVSRRAGLIAAALTATSPLMIWYSQEARAYALLVLFGAASLWFFARVLNNPTRAQLGRVRDPLGARAPLALPRRAAVRGRGGRPLVGPGSAAGDVLGRRRVRTALRGAVAARADPGSADPDAVPCDLARPSRQGSRQRVRVRPRLVRALGVLLAVAAARRGARRRRDLGPDRGGAAAGAARVRAVARRARAGARAALPRRELRLLPLPAADRGVGSRSGGDGGGARPRSGSAARASRSQCSPARSRPRPRRTSSCSRACNGRTGAARWP